MFHVLLRVSPCCIHQCGEKTCRFIQPTDRCTCCPVRCRVVRHTAGILCIEFIVTQSEKGVNRLGSNTDEPAASAADKLGRADVQKQSHSYHTISKLRNQK